MDSDALTRAVIFDPQTTEFLLARVGTTICALPLSCVVETMRPLPIARLANVPGLVLGLCVVRGEAAPVVSAALLLGAATAGESTRFVLLAHEVRRFVLAVDAILGMRRLPMHMVGDLPSLARGSCSSSLQAVSVLDSDLLLVLHASRIVPDAAWVEIQRAEGVL